MFYFPHTAQYDLKINNFDLFIDIPRNINCKEINDADLYEDWLDNYLCSFINLKIKKMPANLQNNFV